MVRNPHSTRPFQHVLEPLAVYLTIAMEQYKDSKYQDYYNVGPDDRDCVTTGTLTDLFCNAWGEGMTWENHWVCGPHEANFLKLDCSKIKTVFGWKPRYTVKEAVEKDSRMVQRILKRCRHVRSNRPPDPGIFRLRYFSGALSCSGCKIVKTLIWLIRR